MNDHIYKQIELTGSSKNSVEEAVQNAITKAAKTLHNIHWFQVVETRGYIENNKYHCNRKRRTAACEPLLADAPVFDAFGAKIANHGGAGFNLLYADGHVSFQRTQAIPGDFSVFVNLLGQASAGRGRRDVVLGVSNASPAAEAAEVVVAEEESK